MYSFWQPLDSRFIEMLLEELNITALKIAAEALGRKTRASKYSPDMRLHPIFGDKDTRQKHVKCLLGPVDE